MLNLFLNDGAIADMDLNAMDKFTKSLFIGPAVPRLIVMKDAGFVDGFRDGCHDGVGQNVSELTDQKPM